MRRSDLVACTFSPVHAGRSTAAGEVNGGISDTLDRVTALNESRTPDLSCCELLHRGTSLQV